MKKKKRRLPGPIGDSTSSAEADEQFNGTHCVQNLNRVSAIVERWLRGKGWTKAAQGWHRAGVLLLSEEGFVADREAQAVYQCFRKRSELGTWLVHAEPELVHMLRIAYEAGESAANAEAYYAMEKGVGRPKGPSLEVQFVELDRVEKRWKAENANLSRRPRASELGKLAMKGFPVKKSLANLVSKWRHSRSQK
jgi:hypothetical protein